MSDRESPAAQKAQKLFRQEAQKREGDVARKEYAAQEEATRRKTAKLKALRLARDAEVAAAAAAAPPPVKPAKAAKKTTARKG